MELFLTVVTLQRGFCMSCLYVVLQKTLANSFKTSVTFDSLEVMNLDNVCPKANVVFKRFRTVRAFHILDYGVHAGNVCFEP